MLFEAKSFPRHKVCGEFVSAESLDLLRDLLGADSHGLMDSAPAIDRARLFLGNRSIEAPVSPAAASITRHDLDYALWQAAESAGVVAHRNAKVTAVQGDGPFEVGTGSKKVSAKALVIAAGRWSQFTPERVMTAGPRWIGIKCHYRESRPSLSTDLYFFEQGYCGVQPVAGDVVNACAMVRSDRATSLAEVFALHPRLARRAASWTPVISPVSTAPLIYRRPRPRQGSAMCAGDAAAFIDPFVGDGISIALRSGGVVAQCLVPFLAGRATLAESAAQYEQQYERQFGPLISAASRVRSLLSLPASAQAMAFELLRIPGVIPLMIRKTRRAS